MTGEHCTLRVKKDVISAGVPYVPPHIYVHAVMHVTNNFINNIVVYSVFKLKGTKIKTCFM